MMRAWVSVSRLPTAVACPPQRQSNSEGPTEEKRARAAFMSAVERSLARDTVVIADSLNYIKGYRYQLYTLSRTASTPHCVAYLLSSVEGACKRNESRTGGYPGATFTELADRFEEPNNQTKWDSPLFCIDSSSMEPSTFDEICRVVCQERVKRPPSFATASKTLSATSLVGALDQITQEVIDAVLRQTRPFGPSTITVVPLEPFTIARPIALGDLASLRRQFIHMNRMHPLEQGSIKELFVKYILSAQV